MYRMKKILKLIENSKNVNNSIVKLNSEQFENSEFNDSNYLFHL